MTWESSITHYNLLLWVTCVFFLLFLSCYVNRWQSYIISNWPWISNLQLITTPVYSRVNKCSKSYCVSILKQAVQVHKSVCHSNKITVHLSSVRKVVHISIESHNDLQRQVNKLKIPKFWWRDWLCSVVYSSMVHNWSSWSLCCAVCEGQSSLLKMGL